MHGFYPADLTVRCRSLDFDVPTHQSLDTTSASNPYAPRWTTRCTSRFRNPASGPRPRFRRTTKDHPSALKSLLSLALFTSLWKKHDELNQNHEQEDGEEADEESDGHDHDSTPQM